MVDRDVDLERRLAFLNLGEPELALLTELEPILEKEANRLIGDFYRHLLAFEPMRWLLRDPAVKQRLLAKQREYLLSLTGPVIDSDYVEERSRIGEVHESLGLEPRWYLGAYSLYFSLLGPIICHALESDREKAVATLSALHKRLTLDADLAMEAYGARRQHDLEYMADELAREGRQLAQRYEAQGAALRITTERARAAEELASIATLVAGLAHEIGTPMGVIQGHAKLLESSVSGEDATWRLRTIQEQVTRISKIIQTLLDMARPRPSRRQPVDLEALLETTLSFLDEKIRRHGVEVVCKMQPASSISGDPERLQQLFLNLFINSIDAMSDEGGQLCVCLHSAPNEEGSDVIVEVSDNGSGIEPANLDKVFDPFFTTKPAGEGNGLGLMVCSGIVGDHEGSIEVSSVPGEGTRFQIHFPSAARGRG
jgi:signal transduction histidine kinase